MKLRLQSLYDNLADSFWFVPALMACLAGGFALASVALDHAIGSEWVQDIGWVWSGGADGARGVLSVIAGSVMTVVSIVFSLTITALAQTSSQFGPRVLRNFTSDRGVQVTLGTFIATFVYCLLVLRTVRSVEESSFVPFVSVNIGICLALASLAVLIFFIHHISQSIQAENLIASVGEGFQDALPILFPERIGEGRIGGGCDDKPSIQDESQWQNAPHLNAKKNGYLQRVDDERLMRVAVRHNCILKLEKRPGDFIANGSPLLRMLAAGSLTPEVQRELLACFSLGRHRTPHQDALYPVRQLAEIAAHALSPGINEPFTALTCIYWLGVSLRGVARRELPSPLRCDQDGQVRVFAHSLGFDELAQNVFDQIRLYGASNPEIMAALLNVITDIAPDLHRASDHDVLAHHARLVGQDAAQHITNAVDRQRIEQHLQIALRALAGQDNQSGDETGQYKGTGVG
jgi:uncharacterized membrane protein